MTGRILVSLRVILIALDELAQTILFGMPFIVGLGPRPKASATISGMVGRAAVAGRGWALIAESIIDWTAERLGSASWHCRRAAQREALL